jgi:phage shock protein PspC (stress-responsive transcriptional regulator)
MAIQASDMIQYLNYAAIGILVIAALRGFWHGFFKSTFFFIWTAGILVLAFLMMNSVSSILMKQNVGSLLSFVDIGVPITNIEDTVVTYLIHTKPGLADVLVDGSDALALVYGITQMVVNIVFMLIVIVLNLTVFKLIGWIIYLIVKPKKRDASGKKRKKKMTSRLLGSGVGLLRGAFLILLISMPIAAIASMSGALDLAMTQSEASAPRYQLYIRNDEVMLVEQQPLDQQSSEQDMLNQVREFLTNYRTSYVGSIAGFVKINDVELDTYVFDSILSVKVKSDNLDTELKFRAELARALEAVNIIIEANDGSTQIDDTIIEKLSPDDVTEIMNLISELDLIDVIVPVGLEYLVNSGDFDEMLEGYEDIFVLEDLKAINIASDIGVLGDVFANALTLIQAQEGVPLKDINYFEFDGDIVKDIFDSLGDLELLQYGLPVALNYALGLDSVEEMLTKQGLTKEDLVLPDGTKLNEDFESIADMYVAIQGLGITSFSDFDRFKDKEFLESINDQAISDGFDALFSFNLINDNKDAVGGVLFDLLTESLPAEYKDLLTKDDITTNLNATEMTNLILLAKVVMSTGILDLTGGENPDYAGILSTANIDSIVEKISGSNLISTKMNDVVEVLLAQFNLGVTLEIPETIIWSEQSGKDELTALLNAAREILAADILSGNLSNLTDNDVDRLSLYLSNSLVIKHNLNAIFNKLTSETNLGDIEIVLPETPNDWTETELNSLLKGTIILMEAGTNTDALLGLTEAQIHTLALSKVLSNTFEGVFLDMVAEGGELSGMLFVPEELTWYSEGDSIGELEYMLLALIEIVPEGTNINDFTINLSTLNGVDIPKILRSKTVEMTLVETVKPMILTGELSSYIEPKLPDDTDYVWYQGTDETYPDGDLIPLLLAVQNLSDLGVALDQVSYSVITTALENPENKAALGESLISSRILKNSLDKLFTSILTTQAGLSITIDNKANPTFWDNELPRLLDAVSVFGSSDLNANTLLGLSEANISLIAKSHIIANVFESILMDMSSEGNDLHGQIYVPEAITWHSEGDTKGELEHLLVALKALVPGGDLAAANIDFDALMGADITVLMASKVIEHTAVETVKPMILTGELSSYIEPKLPDDTDYVWYQSTDETYPDGDLIPLLKAIQTLDNQGVSLTTFDYTSLTTALSDEQSVQSINDTLLSSRIIHNSLDKMFTSILNSNAGFAVTLDNKSNPTFWNGTETEDGELIKLLRSVKLLGSNDLDANAITSDFLVDLIDAGSSIVRTQISKAIVDTGIEIPDSAFETGSTTEIKESELRAVAVALDAVGTVNDVSTMDASSINAAKLTALLAANSVIVNRQISKAIIDSGLEIPESAFVDETQKDITPTELNAIVTALGTLGSVEEVSTMNASTIDAATLTGLLAADSVIVNRQISKAIIDSGLSIPTSAYVLGSTKDIKPEELDAIVLALQHVGSVDEVSNLDTSTIDAQLINDLLSANSLIVNRQISSAILNPSAGLDIPDEAKETSEDIYATELQNLVTALGYIGDGSVNGVSSLDQNSINATLLANLLAADSLIVNRQISTAIINSGLSIPDDAFVEGSTKDITSEELEALTQALGHLGTGSIASISTLDADAINSTLLTTLLSENSLIVNRQISSAVISSGLSIPTDAYVLGSTEDIKSTELNALATALGYLGTGSIASVSTLDADAIDSTLLTNLLSANSVIVNRQISSAVIASGLTIPTDAYVLGSSVDLTSTELSALALALGHLGGTSDSVSSLSANAINGQLLTNLLTDNSVIVNRQISTAIITAGLTSGNTDAIVNDINSPRNGEVKYIEMVGLAEALTSMGASTTIADIASLNANMVSTFSDETIDIMFDPDYTIIYYIIEDELSANPDYTFFLTPTDYVDDNPANRIKREKLATYLKEALPF